MAVATLPAPDDDPKKKRLLELEGFVRGYKLAWKHSGLALREILESELYLLRAPNFEEYLRKKWKISRRHGHDLVTAAIVARNLERAHVKHLLSLRAALALAKLSDDLQPKCLAEIMAATGTDSPTAGQIAELVEKWLPVKAGEGRKPKKKAKPKPWRQRFAGGEVTVKVKAGVDLVALLEEALARARASKAA